MTPAPARILIHGHYNKRNVGDEGLLASLVSALAGQAGGAPLEIAYVADYEVTLPDLGHVRYHRLPNAFPGVLRYARRAHLVVFGGGSQFQDFGALARARYLVKPLLLALAARRVGGAGLSLGPLHTPLGRLLARLTLARMHGVHVRDDESVEMARRLGTSAVRGEDLLLTQTLPRAEDREASSGGLVVSLVPFTATFRLTSEQQDQALGHLATALRTAAEQFPSLSIQGIAFEAESDAPVLRTVLPGAHPPLQGDLTFMACGMDRAGAVLATRLHSLIFAFLLQKPTLVICYHAKVRALAGQLGYPARALLAPEDLLDAPLVAERVHEFLAQPQAFLPSRTPDEVRRQANLSLQPFLSHLLQGLAYDQDPAHRERQRRHPVL